MTNDLDLGCPSAAGLELVADSPSDGWAIVYAAPRYWLVRPPYRGRDRTVLTAAQVEASLTREDFEIRRERFEDWGSVVRAVRRRRVDAAPPEERQQAAEAARRILEEASAEMAREHLDAVERAIEQGRVEPARTALLAILRSPRVQAEPALVRRIAELLGRLEVGREDRAASARRRWQVRDELAVDSRSERIARGGSVLYPAAA